MTRFPDVPSFALAAAGAAAAGPATAAAAAERAGVRRT